MTSSHIPFFLRRHRLSLCLCAALCLTTMAWPARVTAQDAARAAAIDAADARAVDLFRALSEAKSDGAREQAISSLYGMARSKSPDEHEAIGHYGLSALKTSSDPKKNAEFTARRAILAKVIPLMIDTLTGDVQDKAWWVLITVQQDSSPPPNRAKWKLWWRDKGSAMFAPPPAAAVAPATTPVTTPAPARPSAPASKPTPKLRPPKDGAKK